MQYKSLFGILILAAVMLCLNSCGPVYKTKYRYVPPKSSQAKQCVTQCLQDKHRCQQDCQQRYQSCRQTATMAALPQYYMYAKQQRKNNQPVLKKVEDFADFSGCNKDCGCDENYQQCYENCGGKVIKEQQCVAFCGNQK